MIENDGDINPSISAIEPQFDEDSTPMGALDVGRTCSRVTGQESSDPRAMGTPDWGNNSITGFGIQEMSGMRFQEEVSGLNKSGQGFNEELIMLN